jgi:predicted phosphodiesterase
MTWQHLPVPGNPNQTWLLHLSDIHFNKKDKEDNDPYDLDVDLRDQLELDVARVQAKVGKMHGIIVSGDISFAGREPEFEAAFKWLRKLSDICGSPPECVYCVPGNHDADRSVLDKSLNLRNLHNNLRPSDPDHVDALLGEALRDNESATTLFRPLVEYNRFAAKFRCATGPSSLTWEQRLTLNDGSQLVLRGANSVLVSHEFDDNKSKKLILGTLQATALDRPDETVIFICHHPLDWLMDYEKLIPVLNARAKVQLFGHKHLQVIDLTNNCLRIVAGAVHPNRREPKWRPRYNCLSLSVISEAFARKLMVDLYPRVWSENGPKFEADYARCGGAEHRVYSLDLELWEPPDSKEAMVQKEAGASVPPPGGSGAHAMSRAKTLTYRFLSLPHLARLEVAQAMKLLKEEDEGLFDAALFERILQRAVEKGQLAELWDQVESRHDEKLGTPNPYRDH